MNHTVAIYMKEINKRHISEAALFAINNIPEVDRTTLEKFLELVNTTGTPESISFMQLIGKMHLTLSHMPDACPYSLLVLVDLLETRLPPASQPVVSTAISNAPQLSLTTFIAN
jgi:hypothetical protein